MIEQYWVKLYEIILVGHDLLKVANSLGFILTVGADWQMWQWKYIHSTSSTGKTLDKIYGYLSAKHYWDSATYF